MDEILLTVKEVATLKGCTERYIRQLIEQNILKAETIKIEKQGPGRGGIQYRIPLSALDNNLQIKYKREQRKLEKQKDSAEPLPTIEQVGYESLTEAERDEITLWKNIIREWDMFRTAAANKAEGDEQFIPYMKAKLVKTHPNLTLTRSILYRKRKALYAEGETGLIDGRGKHNNHAKKLTDEMFDVFEYYYLDESQKTISLCTFLTELELKRRYGTALELPSKDTFERAVKKIPIPYVMYFRENRKEFIGKCGPYIERMYDDLEPNDAWVADNHTFDIMVEGENKPVRLYLTIFMDVCTRKMMGWCVTDNPGADATIYALKKAIEKYGVPKMIHTDNGREFLFHDFGGNGFRKTAKVKPGEFKPPTILEDLDIKFTTSLPTNARAKGVERAFREVKENFSKLFMSYTGGNILEKPDRLKEVVKKPELLTKINDFIKLVDIFLTGYYNKQPHSGEGMWGKSPDEVFAKKLYEKRIVPEDKLNLIFMRYSKDTIKVGKNGVTLKLYEQKLQYFTEDLWREYFGRDVYVRYTPDDLSSIRIYNTDKQLICVAPLDEKLSYMADKDAVKEAQRKKNGAIKTVANYKKLKGVEAQNALDAVINEAISNLETPEDINPKVIKIIQPSENEQPLQKAVGCEADDVINWTEALKKYKEEKFKTDLTTV